MHNRLIELAIDLVGVDTFDIRLVRELFKTRYGPAERISPVTASLLRRAYMSSSVRNWLRPIVYDLAPDFDSNKAQHELGFTPKPPRQAVLDRSNTKAG